MSYRSLPAGIVQKKAWKGGGGKYRSPFFRHTLLRPKFQKNFRCKFRMDFRLSPFTALPLVTSSDKKTTNFKGMVLMKPLLRATRPTPAVSNSDLTDFLWFLRTRPGFWGRKQTSSGHRLRVRYGSGTPTSQDLAFTSRLGYLVSFWNSTQFAAVSLLPKRQPPGIALELLSEGNPVFACQFQQTFLGQYLPAKALRLQFFHRNKKDGLPVYFYLSRGWGEGAVKRTLS